MLYYLWAFAGQRAARYWSYLVSGSGASFGSLDSKQRSKVRFVDDANNPADFLTKWLDRLKLEASIEYATNSRNAVDATSAATLDRERAAFGAALTLARAAAPRPAANAASAPATATSDATLASALADSRLPSSTELQLIDARTEAYRA